MSRPCVEYEFCIATFDEDDGAHPDIIEINFVAGLRAADVLRDLGAIAAIHDGPMQVRLVRDEVVDGDLADRSCAYLDPMTGRFGDIWQDGDAAGHAIPQRWRRMRITVPPHVISRIRHPTTTQTGGIDL